MSISHFVLSPSFNNAAPFHLFSPSLKKVRYLAHILLPAGCKEGRDHLTLQEEDRSANYLTIIIMTLTTGALGTSAWCQQGQRQKSRCFFREWCRNCLSTWSPGSAGPTTCVFGFADISGQLGHQAQRTYPAQPWFLVWS